MDIVIATRLCIGSQREDVYRHRLAVMAETAGRSLENQTDRKFHWIIGIDSRAPSWVESEVKARYPWCSVVHKDPLVSGLAPVEAEDLRKLGLKRIAMMRLDDDDLLHRTFVERTRVIAEKLPDWSAITWREGYNLHKNGVEPADYPWSGQGSGTVSTVKNLFNPYRWNHGKLGEQAVAKGGVAFVGDGRMWVRTWRSTSDSSAAYGIRSAPVGGVVDLSEFGLTNQSAPFDVEDPIAIPRPVIDGKSMATAETRMVLGWVLRDYQARVNAGEDDAERLSRIVRALSTAFYSA